MNPEQMKEEADRIRDETVRKMAMTPPKPKVSSIEHYSDCAVNNGPALEAGPCTCGGFKAGQ